MGLPLATAFSKVLPTIGFDINPDRIAELRNGSDRNGEVSKPDLAAAPLELTADAAQLRRRLPIRSVEMKSIDAVVLAVPHEIFRDTPVEAYIELLANHDRPAVFVDIKGVLGEMSATKICCTGASNESEVCAGFCRVGRDRPLSVRATANELVICCPGVER